MALVALSDDILLDIMGYFQTPILNAICRRFNRLWCSVYLQLYEDPWGVLHSPYPGLFEMDVHVANVRRHSQSLLKNQFAARPLSPL